VRSHSLKKTDKDNYYLVIPNNKARTEFIEKIKEQLGLDKHNLLNRITNSLKSYGMTMILAILFRYFLKKFLIISKTEM